MLAIAGGKGGCGKTTTALALGQALREDCVVVDADCDMPNLHAMAGVDREPTAADDAPPQRVSSGCAVLSAPPSTTRDADLPALLTRVAARTEARLLVDCPGGAGPDAAAPLSAADRVLLVSTLCAPALRDAAKTAAMARALGCRVEGVVLTRARIGPGTVENLLDCPVVGAVPSARGAVLDDVDVQQAYAAIARTVTTSQARVTS